MEDGLKRLLNGDENVRHVNIALQLLKKSSNQLLIDLIEHQQLPHDGLSDLHIQLLLTSLALIDTNNRSHISGVGEREGRVFSGLVGQRNFGFSHGIGRSGDLLEIQPKALGSAILQRLTHKLVLRALKHCGLHDLKEAIVLPVATGMALSLTLRAMKKRAPERHKVVWLRIDQKSAIKAINLAGLDLVVCEGKPEGDELVTDLTRLETIIKQEDPSTILCVLSTTSCFAPRAPDNIIKISQLCETYNVGHLINNAYGLQSHKAISQIRHVISMGGRIDAIVQSSDKNFLVPVGGSIVTGPDADLVLEVAQVYPGRASIGPVLDLFITLLSMGSTGLDSLRQEQQRMFKLFRSKLEQILPDLGLELLQTPHNDISMAISPKDEVIRGFDPHLGSSLYLKNVSGARVYSEPKTFKASESVTLTGFGGHCPNYPRPYLNVASAVGQTEEEIDLFLKHLKSIQH